MYESGDLPVGVGVFCVKGWVSNAWRGMPLGTKYYIPFFLVWAILFSNYYRKIYSIQFLGEIVAVM